MVVSVIGKLFSPTPDILVAYDELRRRENTALLRLVDTLPRVDGLEPAAIAQARDAVFHSDHPFLLALIGPFGVGKSSLINALLGDEVLVTGPVPTTSQVAILRHGDAFEKAGAQDGVETIFHPAPLLRQISLVDTPGLESVFAQHSERTDSFLHRSDWVVLVMLATQALSASNLKYLETLKSYGKHVLVVVNQVDLLDDEQRATVRDFVVEQSSLHLGAEPDVFLVSARQGLAARRSNPPDAVAWQASGMAAFEEYLVGALDDRERLRQKLQTPLQIARNVLTRAQAEVKLQQQALDRHRSVQENIDAQIVVARQQQETLVEASMSQVAAVFAEASMRGEDAIRELFQPTRALGQFTAGLGELLGLARIARGLGRPSRAQTAFDGREVMRPLDELAKIVADLGPRIEGRDMQDLDDLAAHTTQAIKALPQPLQDRVIGEVRPPVSYNREPLRRIRTDLDEVEREARKVEPARLDQAVRNSLVLLAGWELAVVVAIVLLGTLAVDWSNVGIPILLVMGALGLMLIGVALMAFRGNQIARAFSRRMFELGQRYQAIVREAAAEQINAGVRMRQDVAAPFTRLIAAQTARQAELAGDLRRMEEEFAAFAGEIGGFWERSEA